MPRKSLLREYETSTILKRFDLLEREFQSVVFPTIVIIQYDLRQRSNRRKEALSIFSASQRLVELIGYSEDRGKLLQT